ncbi:uncharacterized protein HMPREF1541_10954 [Cyphellophora europaea CBS 101466]|uniref:Heterokaryon incompatibility domain-containing protein n=1 Tax=Cyphellophora europaea (strain CBS 101466) TaxID=1220924 RepID=W2S836_CYPE1|nr:uncharacterized protein HMPREF1541_10954 [Cyphellophora europaea CBS 101466]ETN44089.1 hypothetical protein HMPREF1541_10954 [Cyphellophora europaea CBS 101466]
MLEEEWKVYAWLGQGREEVACVFKVLQALYEWHHRFDSYSMHTDDLIHHYRETFKQLLVHEIRRGEIPTDPDEDDEDLDPEFNWLQPLYTQTYWTRLCPVQELILANTVILCYGHRSVEFDGIYGLHRMCGSFAQAFESGRFNKTRTFHTNRPKPLRTRGWHVIQAIRDHRRQIIDLDEDKTSKYPRGDVVNLDEEVAM